VEPSTLLRRAAFAIKRPTVLRNTVRVFRDGVRSETLPVEQLLVRQQERAVAHARYAMQSTRFYRDLYADAGITLDDLRDPAAFTSLPIVEKQHVRESFEALRTPEATERNTTISMTGGSTGEPLQILRDTRVSAQPLEWQLFRWWGVHPSDNIAIVFRHIKTGRQQTIHALKWWPSKRIQLDAYRINDAEVRAFARSWQSVRPTLLTGYAGGILELARSLQRLRIDVPPLVAIATTASPLTRSNRSEVESILDAPVYDHYRSSEIPWMAGECQQRAGLHVFVDARVIELVDDDGRPVPVGADGEVIATDLTNRVFPLIRYRLGDRTRALTGRCPCGVTLPRIDQVAGRQTDGLRLPDGTWVAGIGLYQIFNAVPSAVRQYQLDQRADFSVVVRCVRGPDPDAERKIEAVIETLRAKLEHKVRVDWELVDEIPHEGGKLRVIRSAVA
jgi:phenylacetate-CoA ligase